MNFSTIRTNFSQPCSFRDGEDGYCVGGALVAYAKGGPGFPTADAIGEALCQLNPELDPRVARDVGELIIDYNDDGQFDRAWELANKALNHGFTLYPYLTIPT